MDHRRNPFAPEPLSFSNFSGATGDSDEPGTFTFKDLQNIQPQDVLAILQRTGYPTQMAISEDSSHQAVEGLLYFPLFTRSIPLCRKGFHETIFSISAASHGLFLKVCCSNYRSDHLESRYRQALALLEDWCLRLRSFSKQVASQRCFQEL